MQYWLRAVMVHTESGPRWSSNNESDGARVIKLVGRSVLSSIRLLPKSLPGIIQRTLPPIKRGFIIGDCIAGLTVGIMVVPQGLAYAKVANLPVQYGLYSAYLGCLIYCLFGTSKDINLGPTAVLSLITGQIVANNSTISAATIATAAAFFSGLIALGLGVFRLGILLDFFPAPVLAGYTTGAAINIAVTQLPKFLGIQGINNRNPTYQVIYDVCKNIPHIAWRDLLIGFSSFTLLTIMEQLRKKWGPKHRWVQVMGTARFSITVIIFTFLSFLICRNETVYSFSLVKTVPSGLLAPRSPGVTERWISSGMSSIVTLTLASVLEHIAISKALARKGQYVVDTDQELLAIGVTNVVGSFFGAYPVTGSFSRSAVSAQSGVNSPLAGLITGIIVIISLICMTPAFYYIPEATLSAVIIGAVLNLILTFDVFVNLWRISLLDFMAAVFALVLTVIVSVEIGIGAATGFALAVLLYRIARPHTSHLVHVVRHPNVWVDADKDDLGGSTDEESTSVVNVLKKRGSHLLRSKREDVEAAPPGILVLRMNESLIFPNMEYFKQQVYENVYKFTRVPDAIATRRKMWSDDFDHIVKNIRLREHGRVVDDEDLPPLKAIIFDFSTVNNMDSSGLQGLFDLHAILRDEGRDNETDVFFEIHFVAVQKSVLRLLELSGITKPIVPITPHLGSNRQTVVDEEEYRTLETESEMTEQGTISNQETQSDALITDPSLVHLTIEEAIGAVQSRYLDFQNRKSTTVTIEQDRIRTPQVSVHDVYIFNYGSVVLSIDVADVCSWYGRSQFYSMILKASELGLDKSADIANQQKTSLWIVAVTRPPETMMERLRDKWLWLREIDFRTEISVDDAA
ncbi:sulfate permease [Planoprotostelium fungivorum]|uniref:Sulfate permease n=1 Tax=Planoprotostelium fungivorum TaxID=1890364 RepID=A0A2P6NKU4_9EUKA|nr:sulfate permease [Planoprotostelium fungivorum]